MAQARKRTVSSSGRACGEGVVRAFALAAQMALLCPMQSDTFIRRELTGSPDPRVRR
jgi:hypothetical protein